MKCPCTKDCQGRTETCHAECEEYLEYVKYREQIRKHRRNETQVFCYIKDAVAASKKGKK